MRNFHPDEDSLDIYRNNIEEDANEQSLAQWPKQRPHRTTHLIKANNEDGP